MIPQLNHTEDTLIVSLALLIGAKIVGRAIRSLKTPAATLKEPDAVFNTIDEEYVTRRYRTNEEEE